MAPIACDSRIERVVVHARGAVVTRAVTLPPSLPKDGGELVLPGITALAEPASFRAIATGGREVVSVVARFVVPDGPAVKGAAEERLRALELEREKLSEQRSHATGRRNLLAGLSFDLGMNRRLRAGNPRARIEDALATSRLAREELAALDVHVAGIEAALEANQRAIEAARLVQAQANSVDRQGASRPTLACHVRLAAGEAAIEALSLEYVVLAARWWPTYKAWLTKGGTRVRLELDALVAQDSGEDWQGVELAFSTADLVHDARLPELGSLRLGRAQPSQKRGYRPPPPGLDAMFEAYDSAMATLPRAARQELRSPPPPPSSSSASYDLPEPSDAPAPRPTGMARPGSYGPQGGGGAPPPPQGFGPPPPMAAAPAAAMPEAAVLRSLGSVMGEKKEKSAPRARAPQPMLQQAKGGAVTRGGVGYAGDAFLEEGSLDGYADEPAAPAPLEPDDSWLDFDALVLEGVEDKPRRGRLSRVPLDPSRRESSRAQRRVEALPDPARTRDPLASRGRFDHHYDAEGKADVPSNARPHRAHVKANEGPAGARFRTVPRESTEVYREARFENPFGAPLCAGPVDVFLEGALVTTTDLGAVDRGGMLVVGLGVEDRLRVARNARVDESSAGLLGGSTVVDHNVTVDLTSSLGMPVTVEVLERIPVSDDKDVSIKLTSAEPEPEVYDQSDAGAPVRGGRRFRAEVPAGGKAKVAYGYRIKLPAKSEIVGGNRRE
jgi:hypothetical protein